MAWGDNANNLLGFNTPTEEETTAEGNPVEVVTVPQITAPTHVTSIEGKVLTISGCENTLSVATGTDGVIEKSGCWVQIQTAHWVMEKVWATETRTFLSQKFRFILL